MKNTFFPRAAILFYLFTTISLAQHLPTGKYHPNRERTYDIIHFKTAIRLDWQNKKVIGESTIRLRPLTSLSTISLDAHWITVTSVRNVPEGRSLSFVSTDSTLVINLNRTVRPSDTLSLVVQHSAQPSAGLYFVDQPVGAGTLPHIYTYGEGSLHANWLPIYGDPNDKFSTEMLVTVTKPYHAISNGKLVEEKENSDGTRTFHWLQERPHSNYLLALFVGEYDSVQLRPAFGAIPLTCWVPRGRKEEGRYAFRNTTEMVEFFSNRFAYHYPWDKYDQVVPFDYAIGAMENTSITGHRDCVLRDANAPDDFDPVIESYTSNWTAESTISHELAHHWFGDNLTCRSLASIWLNESFATYCMMLWNEHRLGREYLQFDTWLALQKYLQYVEKEHIIRPMEYRWFDTRHEIYNDEHTYLKGGILLNTLRWILGDEDFFKAMSYYLHKHEFSNVESTDLKIAIEESTGKNLEWFFDQWVYGGGHPRFEVNYRYHPDRKTLELAVNQTQPFVEGLGLFKLPAEIRIDTKSKTLLDTVWVENEKEYFFLKVDEKPQMVSFDGRGVLVCELVFEKEPAELLYQVEHDALPGRLWALHQLVEHHASRLETLDAVQSVLRSEASWWLKAEAVLQLQHIHTPGAEQVVIDNLSAGDYHIRKAVAIALGSHFSRASAQALRKAIQSDTQADVAAAAIVSLAKIDTSLSPQFFKDQMSRHSWYDELRIACLTAIEHLGKEKFVPLIKENFSSKYNMAVRQQALVAWAACGPTDPKLIDALIGSVKKEALRVRQKAIELLGNLKVERAVPVLEELSLRDGDSDIRKPAQDAVDEIRRMTREQRHN